MKKKCIQILVLENYEKEMYSNISFYYKIYFKIKTNRNKINKFDITTV